MAQGQWLYNFSECFDQFVNINPREVKWSCNSLICVIFVAISMTWVIWLDSSLMGAVQVNT
ncbi:MAG: hypothetical protein ACKVE4_02335 [Dissulfuribacterales bacterium]